MWVPPAELTIKSIKVRGLPATRTGQCVTMDVMMIIKTTNNAETILRISLASSCRQPSFKDEVIVPWMVSSNILVEMYRQYFVKSCSWTECHWARVQCALNKKPEKAMERWETCCEPEYSFEIEASFPELHALSNSYVLKVNGWLKLRESALLSNFDTKITINW